MSTIVCAQSTGIILNRLHAHEVFLYQLTFLRKSIVKEEGRENRRNRRHGTAEQLAKRAALPSCDDFYVLSLEARFGRSWAHSTVAYHSASGLTDRV